MSIISCSDIKSLSYTSDKEPSSHDIHYILNEIIDIHITSQNIFEWQYSCIFHPSIGVSHHAKCILFILPIDSKTSNNYFIKWNISYIENNNVIYKYCIDFILIKEDNKIYIDREDAVDYSILMLMFPKGYTELSYTELSMSQFK